MLHQIPGAIPPTGSAHEPIRGDATTTTSPLDLQVIELGLTKALNSSAGQLASVGTNVIPGVRLDARF